MTNSSACRRTQAGQITPLVAVMAQVVLLGAMQAETTPLALMSAVADSSDWLLEKSWFKLGWLFRKNDGEYRGRQILNGDYRREQSKGDKLTEHNLRIVRMAQDGSRDTKRIS